VHEQTAQRVFSRITQSDYSTTRDQRFKGGYITRHYGCPKSHVHALQMEVSQRAYLHVSDRSGYHVDAARRLQQTLKLSLGTLLDSVF
jgi:N-formylglutamate amidohydrolase